MDQEVQRPRRRIETAMVNGSGRRRVADPWRVRANRPPSWWRRLVAFVSRDNTTSAPVEFETRTASAPVVHEVNHATPRN
jgi:hypothetical protein